VLGIEIDNYVLVNFDVFLRVVDTVAPNGVEVCVPQAIYDPFYPDEGYGFIEVRFDAGCQRLDSTRLLQYARTRKTEGSDFDRARRQQQVIIAVQQQVVSAGGITNLVTRAPALWQELGSNLRTDMPFETALDLALVSTTIDSDNVQTAQINNLHVQFAKDDDENDILIPVPASISELVQSTFNNAGNLSTDDIRERAAAEGASVIVLNNTTTTGLASTIRERLNAGGIGVVTVGNTQNPDNTNTIIKDYTGNPWTARLIADTLGIPRESIVAGTDGLTSEDIAIVAGPDLQ
jgi:anionic cell wall polymer biosynthesis LytR-Cps2A-Psr (LCP) family protein